MYSIKMADMWLGVTWLGDPCCRQKDK